MRLLVLNARIITMAEPESPGYLDPGWMLVVDDRIAAIGDGEPLLPFPLGEPDVEILDVKGAFVAPGFVSSHSHLFTSGARGLGVDQTLYGWCSAMFSLLNHATPDEFYWCTLHGSLDYISNGVTSAFDFTDPRIPWQDMVDGQRSAVAPLRPIEHQLRQIDGKLDSGIRFVNATGLDDSIGTDEEILDRLGGVIEYSAGLDPRQMLGAAISGSVQWSLRPDAAELEVAAMRRFGIINQAHFLETREEVELQRAKFALYRDAGALGPHMIFGHFIQTTPEIIAEAAAGGAGMSWQPGSNGRLASGFADIATMREQGMTIGVGLDDQACTDISDPWQNMRIGMYGLRAQTGDPLSMMPEEILRLHTLGSATVLGIEDRVGSLEVGKFADFLVVDPRTPDIGPLWHPIRSYVLACGPRNLAAVYIGGRLVNERGASTNPLAAEASRQLHGFLPRIAAEHGHPQ